MLFEWISDRVRLEYGSSSIIAPPPKQMPSLVLLPDDVRMNILLFLRSDDLLPLERAIKLRKREKMDFLRAHSVNMRLSKMALKQSLRFSKLDEEKETLALERQIEKGRRRDLLTRLMSLETEKLASLLADQNRNSLRSQG